MLSKFWAFIALVVFLGCQFDTGMLPSPEQCTQVIKIISIPGPLFHWHNLTFVELPNGILQVKEYADNEQKPGGETVIPQINWIIEIGFKTSQVIQEVVSSEVELKRDTTFITSYRFNLLSDLCDISDEYREYYIIITPHPTEPRVLVSIQYIN